MASDLNRMLGDRVCACDNVLNFIIESTADYEEYPSLLTEERANELKEMVAGVMKHKVDTECRLTAFEKACRDEDALTQLKNGIDRDGSAKEIAAQLEKRVDEYLEYCEKAEVHSKQTEKAFEIETGADFIHLDTKLRRIMNKQSGSGGSYEQQIAADLTLVEPHGKEMSVDPVSLKRILVPIENPVCRHVYDRDTIKDYIKRNGAGHKAITCPCANCPNEEPFTFDQLVLRPDLAK